jgi:predicted O-linked N-acetylglucosamine transferase (SPINDLY family)
MAPAEHMARHRAADLFLDTLPYNVHTTASDALWAGLPVLTCRGETFAGRVAASLLAAARLPDLVTATLEEYESLAIALATSPQRLKRLGQQLAASRQRGAPLRYHELHTTDRRRLLGDCKTVYLAGLSPDVIRVER